MGPGDYNEALIGAADCLCAELGATAPGEIAAGDPTLAEKGLMGGLLSAEDDLLVRRLRAVLTRIAAALRESEPDFSHPLIIQMVLDGAEMMMRGEILKGNRDRLAQLMPDFVFLVALPIVDQDRALELSGRATELIDAALAD
ncbi:MAG: hypothetical protein ACJ75T_02050 [Solirubrobacterales bacterium]